MTLGFPQVIFLTLCFLSVCFHASKNGQPRDGHHDLGAALLSAAVWIGLAFWGGMFS